MASKLLPLKNDGTERFSFSTSLNQVVFRFEFAWNSIGNFWSMILSDSSGDVLAVRKVVIGMPLLFRYASDDRFPTGDIVVLDTSSQDLDPGLLDLNSRVLVMFTSVEDLIS